MIRIPSRGHVLHAKRIVDGGGVGHRGTFDGKKEQQLFGLVAQIIIADLLGTPWPTTDTGFDGGIDIEYNSIKWDVKCVIRKTRAKKKWKCNIPASQLTEQYQSQGYIFMNYNSTDGEFQILGWITKEDFLKKASFHPIGDHLERDDGTVLWVAGMAFHDVMIKQLVPIKTLADLKNIGVTK